MRSTRIARISASEGGCARKESAAHKERRARFIPGPPDEALAPLYAAALPVSSRLDPVQLCVLTALRQQLLVSTHFHQARSIQHHDEVRHAHRAEPVRYQDRDSPVRRRVGARRIAASGSGVALEKGM